MDVFHMTYVRNATFHKQKNCRKHPVYRDKSDTRRKVINIKETLYKTLCSEQFLPNFRICYIIVGRP